MLPAGDLREDKETELVAFIDEILALRIMRGAHGIAGQLFLQDAGILALQRFRSGIAHVRVGLVAVQAAQEELFLVQIEAVGPEFRGAEPEGRADDIPLAPVVMQERCFAGV